MRVLLWGTYDNGKPRVRILRRGLEENGVEIIECHREIWESIEDKSQIGGWTNKLRLLFRWITAYPGLIVRYLRAPKHDALIVGYMGQLDVLIIWLFAKIRGVPLVWDAFLSLYNTVVTDRAFIHKSNPAAWLLYALEWLGCRCADRVVLDTHAHAQYFIDTFHLHPSRCAVAWVGVEPEAFPVVSPHDNRHDANRIVLFYGQFIPLHGIGTIIEAAQLSRDKPIHWVIIGSGQEARRIRSMLDQCPLPNVEWLPWVSYSDLTKWIARADICLGIFGDSDKAARVIPNKVFQVLASGKPLITRDSPAIRELLDPAMPGIRLVPAADAVALANEINYLLEHPPGEELHASIRPQLQPVSIGRQFVQIISSCTKR